MIEDMARVHWWHRAHGATAFLIQYDYTDGQVTNKAMPGLDRGGAAKCAVVGMGWCASSPFPHVNEPLSTPLRTGRGTTDYPRGDIDNLGPILSH